MNRAELAARDVPPESVGAAAELLARLGTYPAELVPDAVAIALGELLSRKHRAGLRD